MVQSLFRLSFFLLLVCPMTMAAQSGRIRVQLRDARTGEVPRPVLVTFYSGVGVNGSVRPNAEGVAELAVTAGMHQYVAVRSDDYGKPDPYEAVVWPGVVCSGPLDVCARTKGQPLLVVSGEVRTIELAVPRRGSWIEGRVIDRTGQPVRIAEVKTDRSQTVQTDAEGRFALRGLPAGEHYLSAMKYNTEYVMTAYPDVACEPNCSAAGTVLKLGDSDMLTNVDVRIRSASTIRGTLQTSAGPIRDANVRRTDLSGRFVDSVRTNSAGAFTFPRVVPGTYFIAATHDGHEPAFYPGRPCADTICSGTGGTAVVALDAEAADASFALRPWPILRGRVTDAANGRPLAGVTIGVNAASATTRADGTYAVQLTSDTPVTAFLLGYARQVTRGVECISCTGEKLALRFDTPMVADFALRRASRLVAYVYEAATNEPVQGANVVFAGTTLPVLKTNEAGIVTYPALLDDSDQYIYANEPGVGRVHYWRGVTCAGDCGGAVPHGATPVRRNADGTPVVLEFPIPQNGIVRLSFRFVDSVTKAPVSGVGVELYTRRGHLAFRSTAVSDADGRLQVEVPPSVQHVRTWNDRGYVDALKDGRACGTSCNVAAVPGVGFPETIALSRTGIHDVVPASGHISGGEIVTIHGGGFHPGARVTFGSASAEVVDATADVIRVRVPPQASAAERVDVEVVNADGTRGMATSAYRYTMDCATLQVRPSRYEVNGSVYLVVDVESSTRAEISWFRGARGSKPYVQLPTSENALTVAARDHGATYVARVTAPCRHVEIPFEIMPPQESGIKRRAAR